MTVVAPGATVGVLGSGQLGRMFAMAARRLGYRVHTFSPDRDTPTGQVADLEVAAPYDDLDAVAAFARQVAVVTFEFENVPAATVEAAAAHAPVRPSGRVLHIAQQRLREKAFLADAGLPVPRFVPVRSLGDLEKGLAAIGVPAVLKQAAWGYDGKGQTRIDATSDAPSAWAAVGGQESILEAFVDFEREVSVVAARGLDGCVADYGVIENVHRRHVLDVSTAPAAVPAALASEAGRLTRAVLEALDVVGVLCVEFFVTRDGRLLINELAPRPHNSGHLTVDACLTSQFEQQLRAVCGLPLGSTERLRSAAMANLLGDLWEGGEPDWPSALALPDVKLHLYGKAEARPGRKMGHLTALAATAEEARARVLAARDLLDRENSMNVLVIGGTRFVGYDLVWRLLAAGHRVALLNRGQLPDPFGSRVERLRGDRTTDDFPSLLAGRSFDAVVDFVAFRGEDARQVVSVLGGRVGHYVAISSGQVYLVRDRAPRPAREADYDGPILPEPKDPADHREWDYGMGKRAVEDTLAEYWAALRFPSTRLRIPMVNGERDHYRRLEGYIWRLLDGGPVLLPDGGDQPTRHVYGGSVARAIQGMLGVEKTFGEAYNLAQDETPTLRELLTLVAERLGAPARLVPVPAAEIREAGLEPVRLSPFSGRWMSFLDPSRAKAELGFRHEPLAAYLDKIVTAFLANPPEEPPAGYATRATEIAVAARR